MKKEYLNPDTLFPSRAFGFSQVVTSQGGKWIHCSGQTAWDKEMNIVGGGDLLQQMRQSLENVRLALAAAGAAPEDVVRVTVYIVNYQPDEAGPVSSAMVDFFKGNPPASTLIGVQALALPDFRVEIEVTAVIAE